MSDLDHSRDSLTADDDQHFSMVTNQSPSTAPASASGTEENKFLGQKERRKSSSVKMFLGDYLSLATNQAILKILAKNGNIHYH
jgi:hypothetical protein